MSMTKVAGPFGHCLYPEHCKCGDYFARGGCPHWVTEQHTDTYPADAAAWQVVYWNNGMASGLTGATRCEVRAHDGRTWCFVAEFDLPKGQTHLERLLRGLDYAHAAGKRRRSAEFNDLLNCERP